MEMKCGKCEKIIGLLYKPYSYIKGVAVCLECKNKKIRDPCEYNPTEKRAAYENEFHASAKWIVGHNGKWHLCDDCVKLQEFKRFKKIMRIKNE
jgi:hypothetical protein